MDKIATNLNFNAKPNLTETSPSPRYAVLSGAASMIAKTTGLSDLSKARKAYQTKNYSVTARHIALSAMRVTVIAVAVIATLQAWNLQKENDLLNTKTVDLDKNAKDSTARIDALNQKLDLTKNTIKCLQTERREAQRLLHNCRHHLETCRGNREYYLDSFCDYVIGNSFPPPLIYPNKTECLTKHHQQHKFTDSKDNCSDCWIASIPPFPDTCKANAGLN